MRQPDRQRRRVVLAAVAGVVALGAGGVAALTSGAASPGRATAVPSSSPAAPSAAAPPPAPLVVQNVQATRLYTARGDAFFDTSTLQRDPQELVVTKQVGEQLRPQDAGALLVVLPLAASAPACVQQASLALDVAATIGGPAEVGIYPGAATSLVAGRLPPSGEADVAAILDNRPRGVAEVTGPGPVEVDVTALARTWTAGGPFPSTGREIEPGTPMLLVLRPTGAGPGTWTVTLASPPALTYRSTPGCRA